MTHPPTVSVVLATYNGGAHLRAQLLSIARQTRSVDEVWVGDDGSTDETLAIVEEFAAPSDPSATGRRLPLRLVRNETNLGSTGNFQSLLGRCTGDVIFFSDQDDVWRPDRVSRSLEVLEGTGAAFVFSDARIIDGSGKPTGESLWPSSFFTAAEQAQMQAGRGFEVLLRHNVVTGATMAIARRVLPWVLPIEGGWVHDGWIALVASAMEMGVAIAEPLIDYRRHEAQQIGALGYSPARLWAFMQRQSSARLLAEARDHRLAAERIRGLVSVSDAGRNLARCADAITAKADFLDARADLRDRARVRRAAALLRSPLAQTSAYTRMGMGWRTLAVDLIAPRS